MSSPAPPPAAREDDRQLERSLHGAVRPTGLQRLSITAFRRIGGPLIRRALRIRVENAPRLAGPFVVVANHSSLLDPLILGSASPRHLVFLMTVIFWRGRGLGWFYRWMRAIP